MTAQTDKKLEGKVAVITGASYGIGRAVAIGLAQEGCDLVLVARDQAGLEQTAQRIRQEGRTVLVVPTDVGDVEQVKAFVQKVAEKFKHIDILFNGASASSSGEDTLRNLDYDRILEICDTTFRGTVFITKALLPLLEKEKSDEERSQIIFMASDWALSGSHGPSVFSAAKAAVRVFSHTLKYEVLDAGIKPTVITAGDIASFDLDWKEPKWDIDDSPAVIRAELGRSRILLAKLVNLVISIATAGEMMLIDEVHISPEDPAYSY